MTDSTDSRSEFLTVRGLRHHVRQWGTPGAPKLFLLHGWMDVSASFQFVAEMLAQRWHLLAPDWRGFGLTDWPVADGRSGSYWFPDYLADLEALLDVYTEPGEAINLIGHSMGGNVACLYAGVRPARVRRLVNLEGFGLPPSQPTAAIRQLGRWLDDLQSVPTLRPYATLGDVAARLRKTNPRLAPERAAWLAQRWARQERDGQWHLLADAAHKIANPYPYRLDEAMAVWGNVSAPVLHVEANDSEVLRHFVGAQGTDAFRERFKVFPNLTEALVADAGHMLHHDQPEAVARLIDDFCRD
ncbi:alpha/beta fold hydrolase [Pandoraea pulmonicola]|uniref:Alpha/beta hydrolase n=1 Tax=Pandoraea pulmonicola TaxID=93221 RepID=A0AAJ4Z9C9_PANPU|nr:alpha/beta hydrolase [Pandoraea pulmonicola]AJC21887.1 alpha/beta hydrolase [Pandoraea pulmonicola]SUA89177.1 Tropinesterase [Pandoraea pulmonicola]